MPIPRPVRLFHITAIANLAAICKAGAVLSKNAVAKTGLDYQNIAYQGAQGARALRPMPSPPGGMLHDYVPFYFAPRSPMLGAINKGRVEGCKWRQADIIHIETTLERTTAGNVPYVFFDRNATLPYSQPYVDVAYLNEVKWDLLTEEPKLDGFCKYWHDRPTVDRYADRMERRQAEFLVRDRLPLGCVTRIGVINSERAAEVTAILTSNRVGLEVKVMSDWYFLGQ